MLFSIQQFCGTLAWAQTSIPIEDHREEMIFPLDKLNIFIDSTGTATFDQILQEAAKDNFYFLPEFKNKDYNPNFAYWVKLTIDYPKESEKVWTIEFYDQTIDQITAYIPNLEGNYSYEIFGDAYPYLQRTFLHKNFHLLLDDFPGQRTYFFRIQSHRFADIRIVVRTIDRFVFYSLNEYYLYGIFYGMVMIICLYNFLMFIAIRERKTVYYIFYLLSVAIYAACVDGIAFQYLWPNAPQWNQIAASIFLYLLVFWALVFSRSFLKTKFNAPILDKVLVFLIVFRSILFVLDLWLFDILFNYTFIEVIPFGVIFYTSLRVWYKGYKPARFFVIAYGILLSGFLIKALVNYNVIPFTITSYYSLHIGFLLEMLFLTFALADRVKIIKNNRDKAARRIIQQLQINADLKEKVNRELEEKVKERTSALNEKNRVLEETHEKLMIQSKELNQINSMLDFDNWKLKNNLKEVLKDRVFPKVLSFNEFKTIFPDESSCMRYLFKLKWSEEFHCKKCHYDKFCEGSRKFSLRCTKCGYDESVTSHTLFQGIRFPINKAFYILYTIMTQNHKLTIDQLSNMLELRRNTVWNFKKKVKDAIKRNDNATEFAPTDWQNILIEFEAKIKATT